MIKQRKNRSFTLIELMIIIAILGVLAALISGNFITSLKKGRDARRKADLEQIQRALEMYYEDNRSYPTSLNFGGQLCHPNGCDVKVYMQKIPTDPVSGNNYVYISTGQTYQLYSCIENQLDRGPGVNPTGYSQSCGIGICSRCKYAIISANSTP